MGSSLVWMALVAATTGDAGFNVDFGTAFGVPGTSFAAAADQPGAWQGLTQVTAGEVTPLFNVSGLATAVTVESPDTLGPFALDNPGTRDDVETLMDDVVNLGGSGATRMLEFTGLAPGRYRIVTYAWAPDSDTFRTMVTIPGAEEAPQEIGGAWPGEFVLGITHAEHTVMTDNGRFTVTLNTTAGFGSLNGIQIVPEEAVPCPADFDGDGVVGFLDLLPLLSAWGPCLNCPEDLDGDGTVGFLDLLPLLSAWGPCL